MTLAGRLALIVLPVTLLLMSCAPKRSEIALDTQQVPASRLVALVGAQTEKLHSLVGRGNLSFESPEMAGSAYFELALKKPDSLLVKLQGPFGIGAGFVFLSRDRFVFYNSMRNRVITGVPNDSTLRAVLPFDLSFERILTAFSGVVDIAENTSGLRTYEVLDGRFHLAYACGSGTCQYWVDPEHLVVTRYEVRDSLNRVVMEASASSLTEREGATAPRRISVGFPLQKRRLSVYYSSVDLNDPNPSFTYSYPSNAQTIVR